jgi:protein required for attachment to host cells
MAAPRIWALVIDGNSARILRDFAMHQETPRTSPIDLASAAPSSHLRDLVSDRPGRSIASDHSGRRSAMVPAGDKVQRDMQDFAQNVGEVLHGHLQAGAFDFLAIFADPHMLGILRKELPASLWAVVVIDLPKNLLPLPDQALCDAVQRAVGDYLKTDKIQKD